MDRTAGTIMGTLIGDALGLGCHWHYGLAELRRDYGEWVTGYTTPQPERGGQNMSRAMLTGALVGAQVGLEGIPKRFIDGLGNGQELLMLAKKLGTQV